MCLTDAFPCWIIHTLSLVECEQFSRTQFRENCRSNFSPIIKCSPPWWPSIEKRLTKMSSPLLRFALSFLSHENAITCKEVQIGSRMQKIWRMRERRSCTLFFAKKQLEQCCAHIFPAQSILQKRARVAFLVRWTHSTKTFILKCTSPWVHYCMR